MIEDISASRIISNSYIEAIRHQLTEMQFRNPTFRDSLSDTTAHMRNGGCMRLSLYCL